MTAATETADPRSDAPSDAIAAPFAKLATKADWSGLDHVGQKVAKALRNLLRARGAELPDAKYALQDDIPFAEWSSARDGRDVLARLRFSPLKGSVGLAIPGTLIAQLVDIHYGGDGRTARLKAELSSAERRYAEKLIGDLVATFSAQWQELQPVEVSFVGLENAPSRLRVARGDEQVLVQEWQVGAGNLTAAKISLVFALEPIRKIGPDIGGFAPIETDNVDEGWRRSLRSAAMDVQLPVRTIFARPEIAFDKLISLKTGDIIPITLPRKVPLSVSGMLFAYGSVGESDGRTAIRIESIEKGCERYE